MVLLELPRRCLLSMPAFPIGLPVRHRTGFGPDLDRDTAPILAGVGGYLALVRLRQGLQVPLLCPPGWRWSQ